MYLFFILSSIFIALGVFGLLTGKVMVGNRGITKRYWKREENPKLFYFYVVFYFLFGFGIMAYGFTLI